MAQKLLSIDNSAAHLGVGRLSFRSLIKQGLGPEPVGYAGDRPYYTPDVLDRWYRDSGLERRRRADPLIAPLKKKATA